MNGRSDDLYRKLKQLLDSVKNYLNQIRVTDILPQDWEEKLSEIKRPEYDISIVGDMKAGKSTLLNALIFGDWVLPTQVNVCTAALTTIHQGNDNTAHIHFKSRKEVEEVLSNLCLKIADKETSESIKSLLKKEYKHISEANEDYDNLTQKTGYHLNELDTCLAAENRNGEPILRTRLVKDVEISTNHFLIRDDIRFIDTPGIQDPLKNRVEITISKLNESDCVILLIPPKGVGQPTIDFLKDNLPKCPAGKIFLVLSKVDMLANQELDFNASTVENVIKKQAVDIENILQVILEDSLKDVYVIPVAAKLAIKDEKNGVPPQFYEGSNLDRLQEHLILFLENTKGYRDYRKAFQRIKAILVETEQKILSKIAFFDKEIEIHKDCELKIIHRLEKLKTDEIGINTKRDGFKSEYDVKKKKWNRKFDEIKKSLFLSTKDRITDMCRTAMSQISKLSVWDKLNIRYKSEVEKVCKDLNFKINIQIFWKVEDDVRIELTEWYRMTRKEKDDMFKKFTQDMQSQYKDIFSQISFDNSSFSEKFSDELYFENKSKSPSHSYGLIEILQKFMPDDFFLDGKRQINDYKENVIEHVRKTLENKCNTYRTECLKFYYDTYTEVLKRFEDELNAYEKLIKDSIAEKSRAEAETERYLEGVESEKQYLMDETEMLKKYIKETETRIGSIPMESLPIYIERRDEDIKKMVNVFEKMKSEETDY